jgi:putative ABC transport system permease protein
VLISPRWRKVFGDISETPLRTALAVVAMAAGAFGLGMVLTAYTVLTRELANTYRDTRPASAILIADRVDDSVVQAARQVPGVVDAEARPIIRGRVRVGKDLWVPLALFVVRDFNDLRMDIFKRDSGAWPPAEDGILLERSCLSVVQTAVARAAIGDSLTIKTTDGTEQSIKLEGTVHAAGLAPGWMDHVVYGFVSWKSVVRSGESESAVLRIVVDSSVRNEAHVLEIANLVKAPLLQMGHTVTRVEIAPMGRHPHADQMDTFLYLLGAFGALTFALSVVMVASMIHALLAEQVKQVGVMKTIGATTLQITGMYLGQVSILAVISLCLGMPLALSAGRAYARFAATMLNATIRDENVPPWVMAIQIAVGVIVPILVSLGPTCRASRITVHEALNALASRRLFGERRFDHSLARIHWLPRPLMLSLRSTFHRRGRLILTVSTLAMGGAVFVSALNVSGAWNRTLADDAATRPYDIELRLSRNYPTPRVSEALAAVPEVERFEFWNEHSAYIQPGGGLPATIDLYSGPRISDQAIS